jgi:NB-ARC domain
MTSQAAVSKAPSKGDLHVRSSARQNNKLWSLTSRWFGRGVTVKKNFDYLSVDALGYELINKRFRNPILEYARKKLGEALGPSLNNQIQALYVKEWEAITKSLDIAYAKGQLRRPIDNLDCLSVNHLPVLFDKYFNHLVPSKAVPVGDVAKVTRKKLLGWLEEIKDIRNPIAHPPQEDLSVFDALTLADACLRVARTLQLYEACQDIEEVQKQLLRRAVGVNDNEPDQSSILSTLPSREEVYDRFVGRTAELEELWAWYADEESRRWVLVGEGGKGKSAIAHQFALGIQRANPPGTAAVLWLSAKKRRFDSSEIMPITHPDFDNLDSALNRLLQDFGDSENTSKTLDVKRYVVLRLLSEFPSLLVIDDIDSIDAQNEDVVEFFTYEAPRTASKVLLTSRRMYPGMARSATRVSGLTEEDARAYFELTSARLGLADRPDLGKAFPKIFVATEGSPLYMEDLLRLCRSLKIAEAVERWKQHKGDAARRYALQRECDLLNPSARTCLEATCWAKVPLSVAQLESILGIGEDEALSAVQELESRFLVPTPEIIEGVPTYRAHRNLEVLVRKDLRSDPAKLGLRNAVESVLRVKVQDSDVVDIARQVAVRLRGGRLPEALEITERALVDRPSSPDLLALRAETLSKQRPPRMVDARSDWKRAYELGLSRRDAFLRWASAEDRARDWTRMYNAAEAGLGRVKVRDPWLCQASGYAASRLGQALLRGLDYETGQEWLEKAEIRLREALKNFESSDASDYQLGRVYRALIVNAQYLREHRRDSQVVYWTLQWLDQSPRSAEAREEARRQSERYSEVRQALGKLEESAD